MASTEPDAAALRQGREAWLLVERFSSTLDAFLCEREYCACIDEGCGVAYSPALVRNRAELTLRVQGDELVGIISNAEFLNERGAIAPIGPLRLRRADGSRRRAGPRGDGCAARPWSSLANVPGASG